MNIYCIYTDSSKNDLEPVIVEQSPSIFAGLLNIIWAIYHRMWLLAFILLIMSFAALPLSEIGLYYLYDIAILFIMTFFASDLREWHLRRRGYELANVVAAMDEDEAEMRFYDKSPAARKQICT